MPKIDQVLIDLVKEEAAKLREALKPEESAKLDFDELRPDSPQLCIYGQATGNCYSNRAESLIRKCAARVYKGNSPDEGILNGKPNTKNLKTLDMYDERRGHYSPIETFIVSASKRRNKKLIQYLRKETDTLDL